MRHDHRRHFTVHAIDLTQPTLYALAGTTLSRKDAGGSKNMYAFGLMSWIYPWPAKGCLTDRRSCSARAMTRASHAHERQDFLLARGQLSEAVSNLRFWSSTVPAFGRQAAATCAG
jgi:predicted alpha/beta-fold hydrolase